MRDQRFLANALRFLSIDAVQKANSGHPGMPMGMADIAEVLWNDFLSHSPTNPHWWNRDRFILSNGHGSMLLYSLLHLTGYALSLDELKAFRQWGSKTPGHPEYGMTPGVETSTGPLGQGIGNAVGMALAEKILAARYNQPGLNLIDHYTYVFLGDGCLMEGLSHEVAALAGTWKLGKLIAFWDDNGISIDGHVEAWFSENVPERFRAYGWQVVAGVDGHNPEQISQAIIQAHSDVDRPTLICCKTQIAFGSPNKANSHESHGAPLGPDEVALTRQKLDWNYPPFEIPSEIYAAWDARATGQKREQAWQAVWQAYQQAYPELSQQLSRTMAGDLPSDWSSQAAAILEKIVLKSESIATRKASQQSLTELLPLLPELLGGSADLTSSNLTQVKSSVPFSPAHPEGNYLYYGVREFGMCAIMNGLALHGGCIPYGGTFLVFSDYARNAIRLAALMRIRVIYVLTHDSIGLGEDGPTHQPVEHVNSLRMIPNLSVWRPADAVETQVAWQSALEYREGPTCLILSRQNLPNIFRVSAQVSDISRGAYVVRSSGDQRPQLILVSTGSEVGLALKAYEHLAAEGISLRLVSMPCTGVFEAQSADYREQVMPAGVPVLAIEAGNSQYWYRWTGAQGSILGVDRFGESAPAAALFDHFGFTEAHVVSMARDLLK